MGQWGEQLAQETLEAQGLRVLAKNWHAGRQGEIDLVCESLPHKNQRRQIIFVEVKTRRGGQMGTALEAVSPAKCARMQRAGESYLSHYLAQYPELRDDLDVRFDIVGIDWPPQATVPRVTHVANALF